MCDLEEFGLPVEAGERLELELEPPDPVAGGAGVNISGENLTHCLS
jgi:hypothetical protein